MSEISIAIPHRELIKKYRGRSNPTIFSMKIFIWAISISFGYFLVIYQDSYFQIPGSIIIGLMYAHGVEIQHQVLHEQGFKNKRANEIIGIILGIPMLVSYSAYKSSHLKHHKYLGTPKNKEFFDYGDQYGENKKSSIIIWLKRLMMPSLYSDFILTIFRSLLFKDLPDHSRSVSKRVKRDHFIMILFILIIACISYFSKSPILFSIWLAPLVLIAVPTHALIELPEHYQCDTKSSDIFSNTRTIRSNPLLNWFTNGNNYHVEHHLLPGLPIDRLHELHTEIKRDIKHYHPTYFDFYKKLFTGKLKNNQEQLL